MKIEIGARKSQLSQAQVGEVLAILSQHYPDLDVEIQKIETKGDQLVDVSLSKIGGKGLFLKEIQSALMAGEIDVAVHSMKDVPTDTPKALNICAITRRADPRDVLVSKGNLTLDELPTHATVATSSLRRSSQLKAYRPDLQVVPLRGNVNTRLKKLHDNPELDGIILAKAGLERLQLTQHISEVLPDDVMVPCVGQGALGLEVRSKDHELQTRLHVLDDLDTRAAVTAERAFLSQLEGSCHVPVGALAKVLRRRNSSSKISSDTSSNQAPQLVLTGVVASLDGSTLLKRKRTAPLTDITDTPKALGESLAKELLDLGAREVLKAAEQEVE